MPPCRRQGDFAGFVVVLNVGWRTASVNGLIADGNLLHLSDLGPTEAGLLEERVTHRIPDKLFEDPIFEISVVGLCVG